MRINLPELFKIKDKFINSKNEILKNWMSYDSPKKILINHDIQPEYFIAKYGGGVFDYFIGVISEDLEIGNCPVMQGLLSYLKTREISAEELFDICSHFRKAMVDFTYDAEINSKVIFDELSFVFDKNFRGILKFYTDTIFNKLIDAKAETLKASQAREYFLSNMSHEIRTPLNAILGFVNLLIDENISTKHRNYLNTISSSGENLLSIINDLLDFSKLRSGKFTIEPRLFSIHEELSHTMELFVASASSKNITITSFINPNIPKELYADSLRIKQIISNFLSNAIKFTQNNGIISVKAKYKNGSLVMSVRDNGPGLSDYDKINIFSAFIQAQDNKNSSSGGTGLGLSISKQLAEHMSGKVHVRSKFNVGSTFYLNIPVEVKNFVLNDIQQIEEIAKLKIVFYFVNENNRYKLDSFLAYLNVFSIDIEIVDNLDIEYDIAIFIDEDLKDKSLKEQILNSDKKYISLMSKQSDEYEMFTHIMPMTFPLYCDKIKNKFFDLLHPDKRQKTSLNYNKKYMGNVLVAEDNEANQELIKILLSKYGLRYDVAADGLEAYNLYKINSYDLILMDEQMPVMDGNEAVNKILKYEKTNELKHTPVSALTANVIKGAKERGLKSGFDSFLGKPIILKELEKVFNLYLKVDKKIIEKKIDEDSEKKILGLDVEKLMQELMLNKEQLSKLIELYIKKMAEQLSNLEEAIIIKDYKKVSLIAHSIKGASSNFRIDFLQDKADIMEKMAKDNSVEYDYEGEYKKLSSYIQKIKVI